MPIKLKNPKPTPEKPGQPGTPEQPGPAATLEERTRYLCKLLEAQMLSGKLRISFGNYIQLMQWREAKGYNRPAKTAATWADPWWITRIEEMHDRPEIQAILAEFKTKGLQNRRKAEMPREV
jgi:hypothetical protein